jgi:hypothetical protein
MQHRISEGRLRVGWIARRQYAHNEVSEALGYDGIIAVDKSMVVKRLPRGFGKLYFTREKSNSCARRIDAELARLNQLKSLAGVDRRWDPQDAIDRLGSYLALLPRRE